MARRAISFAVVILVIAGLQMTGTAGAAQRLASKDDGLEQHPSITIGADNEFNPSNGVLTGNGSKQHPYVISGWKVNSIFIHDTDAYYVVKHNDITGQLVLNWTGDRAIVVDNHIADLRVNENVKRTGEDTSGRIVRNTFDLVGQLRHFNGLFAYNTVGSADSPDFPFFSNEAVNFDGFNGAHFTHNTIYGFVDATLHGHHFSEHYGSKMMYRMGHEHVRYDEVWITNNKIYAAGSPFALRYNDLNHAANDRTATSETDEALNEPHVHHTRVHMNHNTLVGSGLSVEVFNADDEHHSRIGHGSVELRGNKISLTRASGDAWSTYTGISVRQAQGLTLKVIGNSITETAAQLDSTTGWDSNDEGIWMDRLKTAKVYLFNNSVNGAAYGIRAQDFEESVTWWVGNLRTTGVAHPIYWDNSVKSQPRRRG
ncbi:MAG: hypothetical protein M3290_03255 [Actinomycetota bacterium]|nr:hypothetical protein [Actinomycetota bacterium]